MAEPRRVRRRSAPIVLGPLIDISFLAMSLSLLLSVPASVAPSAAGVAQGLTVSVTGTAAAPKLKLTNDSGIDCQIADLTTGLVSFPEVVQDDQAIAPVPTDTYLSDRLDQIVLDHLVTLPAGQSARLPLAVSAVDARGASGLIVILASDNGSAIQLTYPIAADRPVRLSAQYTLPLLAPQSPPLCSSPDAAATSATLPVTASASPADGAGRSRWWLISSAGSALVVLLLVILRRRRSGGTAAAIVLPLVGLAVPLARAPQAAADYAPSADTSAAFGSCLASFRAPGGDPAGAVTALDARPVVINSVDGQSYTTFSGGTVVINWNIADTHPYTGGGNAEA
jgi:hypothetical protein